MSDSESVLDDLFSGRDRFLTSGEVAELLNVNTNTLYLWRQSDEVDLPFHRFIAPGQTRGMIRYKYSDVSAFVARASERGRTVKEAVPSVGETASEARMRQYREKAARDKDLSRPLEVILEEVIPVVEDSVPEPTSVEADEIIKQLLRSYELSEGV